MYMYMYMYMYRCRYMYIRICQDEAIETLKTSRRSIKQEIDSVSVEQSARVASVTCRSSLIRCGSSILSSNPIHLYLSMLKSCEFLSIPIGQSLLNCCKIVFFNGYLLVIKHGSGESELNRGF